MSLPPGGPDLASLSTLDDPVRRRLYEVVTRQPGPMGRDEAAAAAGIGRALAVYHLDKLVESGLLAATYQRPAGRSGPGAGRPAKLYARAEREFTVTVPPRSYELAARLLLQAVEADDSGQSRAALGQAAWRLGAELGCGYRAEAGGGASGGDVGSAPDGGTQSAPDGDAQGTPADGTRSVTAGDVEGALTRQGYEPCRGGNGIIRLRNCPFHQLAERHREVVCGMNLTLVEGLVDGLGADGWQPVLDPRPGYCCVALGSEQHRGQHEEQP
ncbi:MAG TPA: helix-turn-helix domain-containing protein [Streptosporangiaceae bacterium]|nr:helix-turn-helix domain-containing protein [Streptosporangiaceae bacterium]